MGLSSGCTPSDSEEPSALVFAASSLTGPFGEIAQEFEAKHPGHGIKLHFAGTSRLVFQIREGAPADLLASADAPNMQRLVEASFGIVAPTVFVWNRMIVVTSRNNPHAITSLKDLQRDDLRVAYCGPQVPAGRYARQVLTKARCEVQSVSDEPNVSALLSKVQLGELDAAIVYATDARNAGDAVFSVTIPEEHNVQAQYPMAVLNSGKQRATAQLFADFVLSERGQAILHSYGFSKP